MNDKGKNIEENKDIDKLLEGLLYPICIYGSSAFTADKRSRGEELSMEEWGERNLCNKVLEIIIYVRYD